MATVIGTQTGELVLDKGIFLNGTALLSPGDTTLSIPIPTNHQAPVGRELEVIWEVDLEEESGAGILPPVTDPPPHAPTHIKGGTDEIDGDTLDIDFTPTGYIPDTTPPEVTDVAELSAHLAGIDGGIGALGFVEPGTDNIQAAIDALPSTGGIIRFKPGSHVIATTVLINKSDVVIEGPRAAKITTTIAAVDKILFQITTGTDRVTLRGFRIEVPDIGANGRVIEAVGASDEVTIESLRIESTSAAYNGNAVRAVGICNDWVVQKCFFKGRFSESSGGGVIFQQDTSSLRMLIGGCTINVGDNDDGRGITLQGTFGIISHCIFVSMNLGVSLRGSENLVDNCQFFDDTIGVEIPSGFSKNAITGCYGQRLFTLGGAVFILVGDDGAISDCVVDGNGTNDADDGIRIQGARCKASGCKVFGMGTARSGIISNSIDGQIVGCDVSDCGCPGILLFSASAQYNQITGNKIKACTNGVETPALDGLISGNHFRGNTGTEILETGSADFNFVHGNWLRGGTVTLLGAGSVQSDNFT